MNTTLTTRPSRIDHPPHQVQQHVASRVNLLDRLALRIGLALITWGRRSRSTAVRERRATRIEYELVRAARERAEERVWRTRLPGL